jgi:DnaK suppressor protein
MEDLDRYRQLLLAKRREIRQGRLELLARQVDQGNAKRMSSTKRPTQLRRISKPICTKRTAISCEQSKASVRIDRRTFGVCKNCERPISAARLEAVPWTRLCRDCKEQQA